jgi:hypothetical protein
MKINSWLGNIGFESSSELAIISCWQNTGSLGCPGSHRPLNRFVGILSNQLSEHDDSRFSMREINFWQRIGPEHLMPSVNAPQSVLSNESTLHSLSLMLYALLISSAPLDFHSSNDIFHRGVKKMQVPKGVLKRI